MQDRPISEHVRENRSVLAKVEKSILVWLAERLPRWITPDHLTLLALGAMLLVGLSYWASQWSDRTLLLVVAGLALNWLGDSLDGTVARVRGQQRPHYGFYVDHVTDMMGVSFLLSGLAASGHMAPPVAFGLLAGYLMVSAEVFLATYALGTFRLSFLRMGPTELRILLAAGTLYLLYKPMVQLGNLGPFRLFDVGGVCGIAALALTLLASAVRNTKVLYQAEPAGSRSDCVRVR